LVKDVNILWQSLVQIASSPQNITNLMTPIKIYLEAASRSLFIVTSGLPPQARNSCLPPDKNAAKHSVAF